MKKASVGNTRLLLPAKMLLVPVSVLSLEGRLYSGGSKFDKHIDFLLWFLFMDLPSDARAFSLTSFEM